MSFSNPK
jgi:hypothetical protein